MASGLSAAMRYSGGQEMSGECNSHRGAGGLQDWTIAVRAARLKVDDSALALAGERRKSVLWDKQTAQGETDVHESRL